MGKVPEERKVRRAVWSQLGSKERMADEGPCLGQAGMEQMDQRGSWERSRG